MDYRRFGDTVIVRLDKGEDIVEQILAVARKEQLTAASVSGIGATDDFTMGVFDLEKKGYNAFHFTGNHEITALAGNVTTMNGETYLHLHINCANAQGQVVGGHLMRAKISLTCEIFMQVCGGKAERTHDDALNLNRITF